MALNIILAIVLSLTIFLAMYVMGILFIFGKGGSLIAGYHFAPKGEKANKYHKYIMRRIGIWFLLLISTIHVCTICGLFKYSVVSWVFFGLMIAIAVVGIIWFNTSKKIKHAMKMERELTMDYEKEENKKENI